MCYIVKCTPTMAAILLQIRPLGFSGDLTMTTSPLKPRETVIVIVFSLMVNIGSGNIYAPKISKTFLQFNFIFHVSLKPLPYLQCILSCHTFSMILHLLLYSPELCTYMLCDHKISILLHIKSRDHGRP